MKLLQPTEQTSASVHTYIHIQQPQGTVLVPPFFTTHACNVTPLASHTHIHTLSLSLSLVYTHGTVLWTFSNTRTRALTHLHEQFCKYSQTHTHSLAPSWNSVMNILKNISVSLYFSVVLHTLCTKSQTLLIPLSNITHWQQNKFSAVNSD